MNTTREDTTFEDAWADVYWVFAHDDMVFDYRSMYYKQRYLKVKAGLIDFEAMTLARG